MAVIYNKTAYTNIMTLPKSTGRSFGAPLDPTAVWNDRAALETYASSDATAYVGQIVVLSVDGATEAFIIADEAGTLIKLASTVASGDLAGDVATLQGQVSALETAVGKAGTGEDDPATGLYALIEAAKAAADAAQSTADAKVATVTAKDASVTMGGTATAPTVGVQLSAAADNALTLDTDGLKVVIPEVVIPEYTIEKLAAASTGSVATYQMKKDDTFIGAKIEIPKDLVLSSGTVQTLATSGDWGEPGTYIVLEFANSEVPQYINVNGLIEYITVDGNKNDDMVILTIDANHKISASVKDASVTRAKLATDVTGSLDKADSALQATDIVESTTNGSITVKGADVAIHGLGSAAFTEATAYDVAGAAAGVQTALLGDEAAPADETIRGVKKVADAAKAAITGAATTEGTVANKIKTAIEELDYNDTAETGKFVTAVSETDGKIAVSRASLVATDIPTIEQSQVNGLTSALDGKAAKATSLAGYGITDGYTKTDIHNDIVGDLGTKNTAPDGEPEVIVRKTVKEYVDAQITTAKNEATSANSTLADRVTSNENAISAINNSATGILKQAQDYADGLASNYEPTGTAQALINALDKADTAVAGQLVSAVSEENGVITVSRRALVADDIPALSHTKISDWDTELGKKQDNLVFNTAYDAENNKVATMEDVTTAVAGLSGAMHFKAAVDTDPTAEGFDKSGYAAGDVVLFGQKEFVFDGENFILLGDEGSYAIKGAITNADISADAAIAQSKISGLTAALEARVETITLAGESAPEAMVGGNVAIPFATAAKAGLVKSSDAENKIAVAADGIMEVNSLNVNKLVQTAGDTLVLSCGTSASL